VKTIFTGKLGLFHVNTEDKCSCLRYICIWKENDYVDKTYCYRNEIWLWSDNVRYE